MNKFLKNATMLLAAISMFFIGLVNTNAAAQQISLGEAPSTGSYIAGVKFHYKKTTDGKLLYCVDMNTKTAKNIKANLVQNSKVVNGGVYYILKNGYPEKSITGDTDKDYYITQTAVWWYLDETTGSTNLGEMFKSKGSDSYGLRSKVKQLVNAGIQHKNDSIPGLKNTEIKIETSSNSMKLVDGYYVTDNISATKLVNADSYSVTLTNAPSGTIISKNGGSEFVYSEAFKLNKNDTFKIKVPTNKLSTNAINIKVEASATGFAGYTLNEYDPTDSSMQNVVLLDKEYNTAKSAINIDISSSKVSVVKIDTNTRQPLAGAVLVLKDCNGKEVTRWTSTVNAHVIRNLANGSYTVEEVTAPNGYKLNPNVANFTITDTNRDITINFENEPEKVVINISKVDQSTQQQIAGATIVIKDAQGNIVYKFDSKTTPEIITDIGYGTYTVEELSAPQGYIKSDKVYTFTVDANHLSHQITIENAKEVYVPDTANASSIILLIIGISIIGYGISYIKKNGQKKFNK